MILNRRDVYRWYRKGGTSRRRSLRRALDLGGKVTLNRVPLEQASPKMQEWVRSCS